MSDSKKKTSTVQEGPFALFQQTMEQATEAQTWLLRQGAGLYQRVAGEWGSWLRSHAYLNERFVEGGAVPTLQALTEMGKDLTTLASETFSGQRTVDQYLAELASRARSGGRYGGLIRTLGGELFGTARFEGEGILDGDDLFTLSYLPPRTVEGERPPALFHVGGFLPYSDRIFRILPEANLFLPFLERGIGVYAMELRAPADRLPGLGRVTVAQILRCIDRFTDRAFAHDGRKLLLEGYCGLGMPVLAYLAAFPESADRKIRVAATMVAPVDGRKCTLISRMTETLPEGARLANMALTELLGNIVPGDAIRQGLDLPIGAFFPKTPFGQFMAGWKNKAYAEVRTVSDLTPAQRRELAGAYWISPENCRRYPMPADLVNLSNRLFSTGVGEDLTLPIEHEGRPLNLRTIVDKTSIRLFGFYGGRDLLIPEATGRVLMALGPRYTHVVHEKAGHISYVLSPEIWKPGARNVLQPNPIDLMLE